MDKYLRFLQNISKPNPTKSKSGPRSRRRLMERELKKLEEWKKNENKSGNTESTDKTS